MAHVEHVVTRRPEPVSLAPGHPHLEVLCVPALRDNLVWVLADRRSGHGVIVDGPDADGALAAIAREGLTLSAVLNTHTHGDHIGVNHDLARRGLLDGLRVIGPRKVASAVPGLTEAVGGGDTFVLGDVTVTVIDTEGHIDGHVTFVVGRALFCGDALFTGGCGRMFVGPATVFHEGLARLRALGDDMLVFCAHEYTEDNLRFAASVEPDNAALAARIDQVRARRARGETAVPSTLAEERATNPFLRWDAPELIAHVARALPDADLSSPPAIFAATRRLKDLGHYRR